MWKLKTVCCCYLGIVPRPKTGSRQCVLTFGPFPDAQLSADSKRLGVQRFYTRLCLHSAEYVDFLLATRVCGLGSKVSGSRRAGFRGVERRGRWPSLRRGRWRFCRAGWTRCWLLYRLCSAGPMQSLANFLLTQITKQKLTNFTNLKHSLIFK